MGRDDSRMGKKGKGRESEEESRYVRKGRDGNKMEWYGEGKENKGNWIIRKGEEKG